MWLRKLLERQIRILRPLYLKASFIRNTQITPHKSQPVGHFLLLVFLLQNYVCFFNFVKGNSHDYGQDKKN